MQLFHTQQEDMKAVGLDQLFHKVVHQYLFHALDLIYKYTSIQQYTVL